MQNDALIARDDSPLFESSLDKRRLRWRVTTVWLEQQLDYAMPRGSCDLSQPAGRRRSPVTVSAGQIHGTPVNQRLLDPLRHHGNPGGVSDGRHFVLGG